MSEDPEVKIWWHRLKRWLEYEFKRTGKNPLGWKTHLLLFPRTFAEGTAQKPYTTASATTLPGYASTLEQGNPHFVLNQYDLARSKNKPWEYLVKQGLSPGPMHVTVRGKCLSIAAGYHCVTFNFGLEANVVQMTQDDLQLILAGDSPGPNPNKGKANRLRSFKMPERFIEPGSSDSNRMVNIFAAFISENTVFAICDFARLVRMHIISSPNMWTEEDMEINSP
ncbi:hypothetical protein C0989_007264, partial [Termitomyces sp. Mn162]